MHSAVLCWSLNNSVWFWFDLNVQHFCFDTSNFHRCFHSTNWTTKKLLHTLYNEKTCKILFSHEKNTQNFVCTKKQRKILLAHGLSIWQLSTLECWNVTLLLLLLLQKKCEYHRTCCDYLVAAACQDGSAWNERKKNYNIFISWS